MVPNDIQTLHNLPKNSYLEYIKLFPITRNAQVRSYTTLILTLAAVIGFSIFAIMPTLTTITELQRKLDDSRLANESLITKIDALDSLQNTYFSLGEDLTRLTETVPDAPEVPSLFANIQTLAKAANVSVTNLTSSNVSLTQQPKAKTPLAVPFEITIRGTYDQTMQFVTALKNTGRLVTITGLEITRETPSGTRLETKIQAKAYFHPEKEQL